MADYTQISNSFACLCTMLEVQYKEPRPQLVEHLRQTIRNDLRLLLHEKRWSIMSARNLLVSIERTLSQAEPLLEGVSRKVARVLRRQVETELGEHSIAKARYDSVFLSGYKVRTTTGAFSGQADDHDDMKARWDDMKKAIKAAHAATLRLGYHTEERMLKIFMAPEFYFRGGRGGYDATTVGGEAGSANESLVELIQKEIRKEKYKHWLFVLGTVVVLTKVTEWECVDCGSEVDFDLTRGGRTHPVCSEEENHRVKEITHGAAVDNVALIMKESLVHSVTKELVSSIDFIDGATRDAKGKLRALKNVVTVRREALDVLRFKTKSGQKSASAEQSAFLDERMGGSIFTLDGVTFGCEVCLDHGATAAQKGLGRLANASGIQIQLIPSCGMRIKHFETVENGVVFNVDGKLPHVQAVGDLGKGDIGVFESLVERRPSGSTELALGVHRTSWDEDEIVELMEIDGHKEKGWKSNPAPAPSPVNAPNGSVVQYGPFYIPKP